MLVKRLIRYVWVALALLMVGCVQLSGASYTINHITTQVTLNISTSASVQETFNISVSNSSVSQYISDRTALNLTLSNWQSIIGSSLTQHIINPKTGVYNFRLLPGPLLSSPGGVQQAVITILYDVNNVTAVNQTAPRTFVYSFNPDVFNYQHEQSGEVLTANSTLTIILPKSAKITTIFPIPDYPTTFITGSNVTTVSWFYQEPLSKFALTFVTGESVQHEVLSFFAAIYDYLGIFTYVIIIVAVLLFILYTYFKTEK